MKIADYCTMTFMGLSTQLTYAQSAESEHSFHGSLVIGLVTFLVIALFCFALSVLKQVQRISNDARTRRDDLQRFTYYIKTLNSRQIDALLKIKRKVRKAASDNKSFVLCFGLLCLTLMPPVITYAREPGLGMMVNGGFIIALILILIPVVTGIILLVIRIRGYIRKFDLKRKAEEAIRFANYLEEMPEKEIVPQLEARHETLTYKLEENELSGDTKAEDKRGIIQVNPDPSLPFVAVKKKATKRPAIDPRLARLVLWFSATATFWLIFGTTVGEYVGIKFVSPDIDHVSWLSFGRLRPVHTNAVFWGWASLGMLALGYYAVPRVGNNRLYSYRLGWISLGLINIAVVLGTWALMVGINNSGGEFREYIWPIMLLFALALILTLFNFIKTIARRKTKEIYISNWYMVAALMFAIVITLVAYLPFWQNGLGDTIVQGYYMHQGVGMWFMMFTLGLVYYYLPQQLNRPIYSYSLGILAYWTQILFYTLIGTHHFVFSSIPWWLQTVAIVGSAGMIIPVVAGSTNFIMTFKGAWYKLGDSYTLPFFLVGIVFYFTGSLQGTAEAFREANLIWHFTDFTVAHSHLTMYGIITFFIWAGMYAIIPRLTGKEPPQIWVGAHFWIALMGLMFYAVPLMIGGTMRGMAWMESRPFIETVVLMAPHWLWRAVGGSLMWLSHLVFAYNLYYMWKATPELDVKDMAIERLEQNKGQI